MMSIREMEADAARIAAMSPEARAQYDRDLAAHRRSLGLDDDEPSPWQPETDPRRVRVYGKASEELAECTAAIARCLIQGIDEAEPVTGKPNRAWLWEEIADVEAQLEMLKDELMLDRELIGRRRERKRAYMRRWLDQVTPVEVTP